MTPRDSPPESPPATAPAIGYAALLAAGVPRRALRTAVEQQRWQRATPGGYVPAEDDARHLLSRARAVAAARPDAVACRFTAAWLHGLDLLPPGASPTDVPAEFYVGRGAEPLDRRGVLGRSAALPAGDLTVVQGIRVVTPQRNALDLGRYLERMHAVAAVDAYLHAGLVTLHGLRGGRGRMAGERFVRHLDAVLRDAEPRTESPGESWLRVVLLDAGLPRPEAQVEVYDDDGLLVGRLDLGIRQYLVGYEYDGEEFHTTPVQVAHDEARRAALRRLGWDITVARKGDVLGDRTPLVIAAAESLCARGWPGGAGVRLPGPHHPRRPR